MEWKVFLDHKKQAMKRLEEDMRAGKVDDDIIPLLSTINKIPKVFTTSSCSGRIQIIDIPEDMSKERSIRIGVWHRPVSYKEVSEVVFSYSPVGVLWFKMEPMIISIAAFDIETAAKILAIGRKLSLKNSAVRAISERKSRIIVELCGTEKIDAPLGHRGKILCSEEYLRMLVDLANIRMNRVKLKLSRLKHEFEVFLL